VSTRELGVGAAVLPASRAGLHRATWALAWPVIFAFSIESVVGLCDALMVGRLGATAVAAVGVGVQILSAVNAALFAVGTGTLAVVARHVGAGERAQAEETLRQSILAAIVLSILSIAPVVVWAPWALAAFRIEPAVVAAGTPFVRIVLLSVPAAAVVFVIASSLRGAGDTRTPLAIGAVIGTLNVVAAYGLIFGALGLPPLGVAGAASGTLLAFSTGAGLALVLLARGRLVLHVHWRRFRVRGDVLRRVLRVGYPAAIEHLLMQVGFFVYIVFAARYGTAPVAAYFIGVRILAVSFLPGIGFGAAGATLVGQSLGAGRPAEAERGGWAAVRLAVVLMSTAGVVIFAGARPIARLFVSDPVVVADAVSFIRVLAVAQPLMALDFALGGALRGAGDTRFPLLTVLLGFYVCRLGFAWVASFWLHWDLLWLWLAVIGDYVVRSVLKARRFRSGHWKRVRV
jgi:putative MATE family efflux protein